MSELPTARRAVTALIIGTCGVAGYAVIGADRVAGQPSRLQPAVAGHRDGTVHAGLPSHGVQNL